MAEVTIRFRHNPRTGKRDLTVGFESDDDALPHEHEKDHRAMVEALLGQKLGEDVGEIHIERVAAREATPEVAPDEAVAARAPATNRSGG